MAKTSHSSFADPLPSFGENKPYDRLSLTRSRTRQNPLSSALSRPSLQGTHTRGDVLTTNKPGEVSKSIGGMFILDGEGMDEEGRDLPRGVVDWRGDVAKLKEEQNNVSRTLLWSILVPMLIFVPVLRSFTFSTNPPSSYLNPYLPSKSPPIHPLTSYDSSNRQRPVRSANRLLRGGERWGCSDRV